MTQLGYIPKQIQRKPITLVNVGNIVVQHELHLIGSVQCSLYDKVRYTIWRHYLQLKYIVWGEMNLVCFHFIVIFTFTWSNNYAWFSLSSTSNSTLTLINAIVKIQNDLISLALKWSPINIVNLACKGCRDCTYLLLHADINLPKTDNFFSIWVSNNIWIMHISTSFAYLEFLLLTCWSGAGDCK